MKEDLKRPPIAGKANLIPLSLSQRFYIYAIHGYVAEVTYTAIWDVVYHKNNKLHGITSIWCLFIYGICMLVLERLYFTLRFKISLLLRGFVYVIWIFLWEFSSGFLLRLFDACPWDYSMFKGNIMGLITMEYAPMWYIGGILTEKLVISFSRQLYWGPYLGKEGLVNTQWFSNYWIQKQILEL